MLLVPFYLPKLLLHFCGLNWRTWKIYRRKDTCFGTDIMKFKGVGGRKTNPLPQIPGFATNNAHMFYLVCYDLGQRNRILDHLKVNGILAVFHYLSLNKSPFYKDKHDGRRLKIQTTIVILW
jgi:dTDP-4-amino-4,6-dideoxygalactose transaminase